ncbi:MAG: universal stress protein [Alphaproteobacteria bacterium]|nr:universal stress protein [Alphaproteobacteria bacterium]MBL7097761.1 universal stress protein [Alphaproteobacteria bacterium]
MSIARILVPAFGFPQDGIALAAGIAVAKPFNAHVQLLAVHPYPTDSIPIVGVPLPLEVVQAIVQGRESYARETNARLREMLAATCACAGATQVQGPRLQRDGVTCSFRAGYGDLEKALIKSAVLSDLVVLGPLAADTSASAPAFLGMLRGAQKPVLISKQAPAGRLRKIVVGWDGSASAARAIRQSIPVLRCAEQVAVTSIILPGHAAPSVEGPSAYLDRHDVRFHCRKAFPGNLSAADALLAEAKNDGADLVVAGGYGHDQLWEAFFGGATVSLLADAAMPVLLVH